jgi:cell division septation protein DedD
MMKNYLLLGFFVFLTACTTEPQKMNYVVLERIGGAVQRPTWISDTGSVIMGGETITSFGVSMIPIDFSLDRGYAAAESSAKKGVIRELQRRVLVSTNSSNEQADAVSNKAIANTADKIKVQDKYWEKVSVTDAENGEVKKKFYRVYVLVSLSKDELHANLTTAVDEARKEVGLGQLSDDTAKKVLKQTTNILSPVVVPPPIEVAIADTKVTEAKIAEAAIAASVARKPASLVTLFTLQVYALSSRENALKISDSFKNKGVEAFLSEVEVKGQKLYRVVIGRYSTWRAAHHAAKEIKAIAESKDLFVQSIQE